MSSAFQASPISVGDLLTRSNLFQVPSFQRHYSWTTEQAERLLNDLLDASDDTDGKPLAEYFLGSIVLLENDHNRRNGLANGTKFIIDGQQRLITITIILALLRDLTENKRRAKALNHYVAGTTKRLGVGRVKLSPMRIAIREHAQEFFRKYVQTQGSTLLEIDDETALDQAPTSCIASVRDELRPRLIDLGEETRDRLAKYLTEACILIEIVSSQIDRAFAIFSVINDTGKKLTLTEILKAQIIGELPEEKRVGHLDKWTAFEASLDKRFEPFFGHLRTAFGKNQKAIINEIIDIRDETGSSETFMKNVFIPYATNMTRIFGTDTVEPSVAPSQEMKRYFSYWQWLNHDGWVAPVLRWLDKNPTGTQETTAFFSAFDQLLYGLVLLGHGHNKRVTRMRRILRAIDSGEILNRDSGLYLTSVEQSQALYNASNNLYSRSQVTCRLILLRLNDELLLQQGKTPLINPNAPNDSTIEHILPRKPSQESQWRDWFSDPDVREYCTNSLGNFLLISDDTNSKLRNFEFARKHELIFDSDDLSNFPLTQQIASYKTWEPRDVIERNENFLELVSEMFGLKGKKGLEILKDTTRKRFSELHQNAA